ncbi:unnamed protein product [Amoebophrya sp. A120]|nr:unnamed protein product [Amoebophrya sp. A120]|eukprot:GSA120T00017209001.1
MSYQEVDERLRILRMVREKVSKLLDTEQKLLDKPSKRKEDSTAGPGKKKAGGNKDAPKQTDLDGEPPEPLVPVLERALLKAEHATPELLRARTRSRSPGADTLKNRDLVDLKSTEELLRQRERIEILLKDRLKQKTEAAHRSVTPPRGLQRNSTNNSDEVENLSFRFGRTRDESLTRGGDHLRSRDELQEGRGTKSKNGAKGALQHPPWRHVQPTSGIADKYVEDSRKLYSADVVNELEEHESQQRKLLKKYEERRKNQQQQGKMMNKDATTSSVDDEVDSFHLKRTEDDISAHKSRMQAAAEIKKRLAGENMRKKLQEKLAASIARANELAAQSAGKPFSTSLSRDNVLVNAADHVNVVPQQSESAGTMAPTSTSASNFRPPSRRKQRMEQHRLDREKADREQRERIQATRLGLRIKKSSSSSSKDNSAVDIIEDTSTNKPANMKKTNSSSSTRQTSSTKKMILAAQVYIDPETGEKIEIRQELRRTSPVGRSGTPPKNLERVSRNRDPDYLTPLRRPKESDMIKRPRGSELRAVKVKNYSNSLRPDMHQSRSLSAEEKKRVTMRTEAAKNKFVTRCRSPKRYKRMDLISRQWNTRSENAKLDMREVHDAQKLRRKSEIGAERILKKEIRPRLHDHEPIDALKTSAEEHQDSTYYGDEGNRSRSGTPKNNKKRGSYYKYPKTLEEHKSFLSDKVKQQTVAAGASANSTTETGAPFDPTSSILTSSLSKLPVPKPKTNTKYVRSESAQRRFDYDQKLKTEHERKKADELQALYDDAIKGTDLEALEAIQQRIIDEKFKEVYNEVAEKEKTKKQEDPRDQSQKLKNRGRTFTFDDRAVTSDEEDKSPHDNGAFRGGDRLEQRRQDIKEKLHNKSNFASATLKKDVAVPTIRPVVPHKTSDQRTSTTGLLDEAAYVRDSSNVKDGDADEKGDLAGKLGEFFPDDQLQLIGKALKMYEEHTAGASTGGNQLVAARPPEGEAIPQMSNFSSNSPLESGQDDYYDNSNAMKNFYYDKNSSNNNPSNSSHNASSKSSSELDQPAPPRQVKKRQTVASVAPKKHPDHNISFGFKPTAVKLSEAAQSEVRTLKDLLRPSPRPGGANSSRGNSPRQNHVGVFQPGISSGTVSKSVSDHSAKNDLAVQPRTLNFNNFEGSHSQTYDRNLFVATSTDEDHCSIRVVEEDKAKTQKKKERGEEEEHENNGFDTSKLNFGEESSIPEIHNSGLDVDDEEDFATATRRLHAELWNELEKEAGEFNTSAPRGAGPARGEGVIVENSTSMQTPADDGGRGASADEEHFAVKIDFSSPAPPTEMKGFLAGARGVVDPLSRTMAGSSRPFPTSAPPTVAKYPPLLATASSCGAAIGSNCSPPWTSAKNPHFYTTSPTMLTHAGRVQVCSSNQITNSTTIVVPEEGSLQQRNQVKQSSIGNQSGGRLISKYGEEQVDQEQNQDGIIGREENGAAVITERTNKPTARANTVSTGASCSAATSSSSTSGGVVVPLTGAGATGRPAAHQQAQHSKNVPAVQQPPPLAGPYVAPPPQKLRYLPPGISLQPPPLPKFPQRLPSADPLELTNSLVVTRNSSSSATNVRVGPAGTAAQGPRQMEMINTPFVSPQHPVSRQQSSSVLAPPQRRPLLSTAPPMPMTRFVVHKPPPVAASHKGTTSDHLYYTPQLQQQEQVPPLYQRSSSVQSLPSHSQPQQYYEYQHHQQQHGQHLQTPKRQVEHRVKNSRSVNARSLSPGVAFGLPKAYAMVLKSGEKQDKEQGSASVEQHH